MKLSELNAEIYSVGGNGSLLSNGQPMPEVKGAGLLCDCPCGNAECQRLMVPFANPIGGGSAEWDPNQKKYWQRTGDTLDELTLTPSVQRLTSHGVSCGWHGFITSGEAKAC